MSELLSYEAAAVVEHADLNEWTNIWARCQIDTLRASRRSRESPMILTASLSKFTIVYPIND